jgi:hypothetical protein
MKFKGFDKQSRKLQKFKNSNKRFTIDGTEFTMDDIPDGGVIMVFDKIMYFPEGRLAEKIYYPTSLEGSILYPPVPASEWKNFCFLYGVSMPTDPVVSVEGEALEFWDWVRDNNLPITLCDCHWEVLRLLSRGVIAAYHVAFTNRPRESRDFN